MKAAVDHRPFDLRTPMPEVGNAPTSAICKPKNRSVQADLPRWVARRGVRFRRKPQIRELDSRGLLRATHWAGWRGQIESAATALFDAMWGEPQPLRTAAEVAAMLRQDGVEAAATEVGVEDPAWDAALAPGPPARPRAEGCAGRRRCSSADEMFFGNDRLDVVRDALERAS